MTTVEVLAQQLEQSGVDAATYASGDHTLRVVAGRPGSVCFSLLREIPPAIWMVLAEGFTLDGAIHFTQRTLPDAEFERILRRVIDDQQPAERARLRALPEAQPSGMDLAADL